MDEQSKRTGAVERGYEGDDLNVSRLLAFAGGVVGLVIFGALGSAVVFHFFVRHQPLGPPASPFEDVRTLPPEPRLQTTAPQDLNNYRNEQDKTLNTYGWVDPTAGVVRIPVTRAMDILLQKGYPVRTDDQGKSGKANTPSFTPRPPKGADNPAPVAPQVTR